MVMKSFISKFFLLCLAVTSSVCATSVPTPPPPTATVYVKMKDGAELPTDLYYPPHTDISNEYPCILIRVPAGRKAAPWTHLAHMAGDHYVIAIQDTRSAIDTEGKSLPCLDDSQDGYDAVEWLAASSFTNGKIGTLGCSGAGITQIMLAPTAPPSLRCQYIGQAAGSLYHHVVFPGGQFSKNLVESWLGAYASNKNAIALIKSQPIYNDFWGMANSIDKSHNVDVPAVHYAGWFDPFLQGTIDAFQARNDDGKEGAKGKQKLLIGPWNHYWPYDLTIGEFEVVDQGKAPPVEMGPLRWFDRHLKGLPNGAEHIPTVIYFVMGPFDGSPSSGNVWRFSDTWPIPAKMTEMYLTADKNLSKEKPASQTEYQFASDPNRPVPTIGGKNIFLDSGPMDQSTLEGRDDVVVFTTEPFAEDTEITGNIIANMYFMSNVEDTDISIRLTDVYPDGKSLLILDGIARTGVTFHNAPKTFLKEPTLMPIDLETTSLVFAKGHKLRIIVAGTNYPRFEASLNLDAEGKPSVAKTTIFTGPNTPSHLLLPVIVSEK